MPLAPVARAALLLLAVAITACRPQQFERGRPGRTPVESPIALDEVNYPRLKVPNELRPTRCEALLKEYQAERGAHWERQSTVLSGYLSGGGIKNPRRVARARATLYADPTLPDQLTVAQFKSGVVVAVMDLEREHNGLAKGAYCIVTRYAPRQGSGDNSFDRRDWQMLAYRADGAAAPAAGYLPFIERTATGSAQHGLPARAGAMPYPPARWEFVANAANRPPGQTQLPVPPRPRGAPGISPAEDGVDTPVTESQWVVMALWHQCPEGCCTGGADAIRAF